MASRRPRPADGPEGLFTHRAFGGDHYPGPPRRPRGPASLRASRPEQAGRGPGADRAVRRGARPVPVGCGRLSALVGRPLRARADPQCPELEWPLSQEKLRAAGSLGQSISVQVLPGRPRRLRHLDARGRRSAGRRGRERRRDVVGDEVKRGYTLIEVVVVLVVLAVAAGVVVPAAGQVADTVRIRAQVSGVASFLRFAREQAVTQHRAYDVQLDPEAHALVLRAGDGAGAGAVLATRALAPTVRLETDRPLGRGITFYPHGLSRGGRAPHPTRAPPRPGAPRAGRATAGC